LSTTSITIEWGSPQDDGMPPILYYEIFLDGVKTNMSTVTSIALHSIAGDDHIHLLQIRAVNCVGAGSNMSQYFNLTGEAFI